MKYHEYKNLIKLDDIPQHLVSDVLIFEYNTPEICPACGIQTKCYSDSLNGRWGRVVHDVKACHQERSIAESTNQTDADYRAEMERQSECDSQSRSYAWTIIALIAAGFIASWLCWTYYHN